MKLIYKTIPIALAIAWVLLLAYHAFAAGTRVQIATSTPAGTPTSFGIQYPSSVTMGNTLLICVNENWGAANQINTVTDTLGDTWAQILSTSDGSFVDGSMWYAIATSTGTDNVTTTLKNTGNSVGGIIMEYSGMTASPIQATSSAHATSANALSSGNVTTTLSNETLVGCTTANSASQTLIGNGTYSNAVQANNMTTAIVIGTQDKELVTTTTASSSMAYSGAVSGHQTSLIVALTEATATTQDALFFAGD